MKFVKKFLPIAIAAFGVAFGIKAFEAGNPAAGGEDVTEQCLVKLF